jgi:hypothetical protein
LRFSPVADFAVFPERNSSGRRREGTGGDRREDRNAVARRTKMSAFRRGLWSVVVVLWGCAEAEGEDPGSVVCTGFWNCNGWSDLPMSVEAEGTTDDGCRFGGLVLRPDGTVAPDDDPLAPYSGLGWSSPAAAVRICVAGGSCLTCDPDDPAAQAEAGEETPAVESCTGWPTSCGSLFPGWCSSVRGCRLHNRVRWDGSLDPECTGTAYRCDEMLDREHCIRQGCDWGPG